MPVIVMNTLTAASVTPLRSPAGKFVKIGFWLKSRKVLCCRSYSSNSFSKLSTFSGAAQLTLFCLLLLQRCDKSVGTLPGLCGSNLTSSFSFCGRPTQCSERCLQTKSTLLRVFWMQTSCCLRTPWDNHDQMRATPTSSRIHLSENVGWFCLVLAGRFSLAKLAFEAIITEEPRGLVRGMRKPPSMSHS